jgi:hypothetical protein
MIQLEWIILSDVVPFYATILKSDQYENLNKYSLQFNYEVLQFYDLY